MKYQFCIRFTNIDKNSAATKAVADCNAILTNAGYKDYTLTVPDNANKRVYYYKLLKELSLFYFAITRNASVMIQYPLMSINNVFGLFIRVARLKKVRFTVIIHDLESLRSGGNDALQVTREIDNLNKFDTVIAHNNAMINWLTGHGLKTSTVSLQVFDYLAKPLAKDVSAVSSNIVFAGNLAKSTFLYALGEVSSWNFFLYGPGFNKDKGSSVTNVKWCGEYSPNEILNKLEGSFGLIWDGETIEHLDIMLGNYLKYNNPHKFSLYIAAGLPVIAPAHSAIGTYIREKNIGLTINSLRDLNNLIVDQYAYRKMVTNLTPIREKVMSGGFFGDALKSLKQ